MPDGRHLMAYTLYAVAAILFIVEHVVSLASMRNLQKRYPDLAGKPFWRRWQHPDMKDIRKDPEFRAFQARQIILNLLTGACFVMASWLLGSEAPSLGGWFPG